ncbi:hypothetical protein COOONC_26131, partial [Cooperia oncophora]
LQEYSTEGSGGSESESQRCRRDRAKIEEIAVNFYTDLYRSTMPVSRIPTPTQDAAPQIEEWEVEHALRQMKPGKAPEPEYLSRLSEVIKQLTRHYYNRYMDAQEVPDQWKTSSTVLLFKKGERDLMKNYRPIALLSQPYKLFTKVILNRLEKQLDDYQPVEQAGFRKGFCCMDHIHTVTQLIERTKEYKQLLLYLIDNTSVELDSIWNALHHAGVDRAT